MLRSALYLLKSHPKKGKLNMSYERKQYTNPLDFLLTENMNFGESSTNEVELPGIDGDEEVSFAIDNEMDNEDGEDPEHEASETPDEETKEDLDTLSKELDALKDKITELKTKYPEDVNNEVAKALDDATSAIDLAVHHLGDIGEDLGETTPEGGESEEGEGADEDFDLGFGDEAAPVSDLVGEEPGI